MEFPLIVRSPEKRALVELQIHYIIFAALICKLKQTKTHEQIWIKHGFSSAYSIVVFNYWNGYSMKNGLHCDMRASSMNRYQRHLKCHFHKKIKFVLFTSLWLQALRRINPASCGLIGQVYSKNQDLFLLNNPHFLTFPNICDPFHFLPTWNHRN